MTTVYLIRHSKPIKVNNTLNLDNLQIQNEKQCLSIEGEHIAQERLNSQEFDNLDVLYSSNYVRTIQTAKYLAEKNNLEINIVSDLGERKFGIDSWAQLPENFERKQFLDENYKIGNGESQKEVRERMYKIVMKIINKNKDKRIAIVSHGTAISFLLKKWCKINYCSDYIFNEKIFFDGNWKYCQIFKLEFDENNTLKNIEDINLSNN